MISTINATGIAAKTETPKPAVDLSGNEINDNDAISSLIRDESTESSVQKDARKTPAPFEEHDDLDIPAPTKPAVTEEEVDTDSGAPDDEFMPGEIIVRFKDVYSASKIAKLIPNIKIVKTKDIYESVYNSAIQNYSVDASKLKSLKEEIGKYFVITISDKSQKGVLKIIKLLKNFRM